MESNVEYQYLRPQDMIARREAAPIAYMGLGVLEWHGLHNPLGLDTIKANAIACYLAREYGGVVMPPQYWGEYRGQIAELDFVESFEADFIQPENKFDHTHSISELMGLTKEAFINDAEKSFEYGEWELWEKLMVRTMCQIETLGFKAMILLPGHFPLIAPCKKAVQRYRDEGGLCDVLVLTEFDFTDDEFVGDHAAAFETSLMMAICPDLVDLNKLDPDLSKPNIGVIGQDPRTHTSKDLGQKALAKFAASAADFIHKNIPG